MKLWVEKLRKDNKYKCVLGADSGWRKGKIYSRDDLIKASLHGYEIIGLFIDPMEWPETPDLEHPDYLFS